MTRLPPLPQPRVLISAARIRRRVLQLAHRIEQDHVDRDLVIVALLNGTVLFLADLVRQLRQPLRIDFMGASSYRNGTRPGRLVFTRELKIDVRGRDVLLLDDILDTGQTLHAALVRLRALRPRRIRVCVLLDKRARRERPVQAHYVGFKVPDAFVVGYGLDYQEHYRQLPFVGVLPAVD